MRSTTAVFLAFCCCLSSKNFAQSPQSPIVEKTDSLNQDSVKIIADTTKRKFKRFQIGALIGPDIVRLDVEKNATTQNIEVNNALGFHLGIACRFNFSKRFYLLPQASLAFRATSITYNQSGLMAKEDFAPLTLECPVHFVFKTHPDKRFNTCISRWRAVHRRYFKKERRPYRYPTRRCRPRSGCWF
ncbi:MAG: PorT family protein [Saprospiraceae bacterium]|nr:PorT family protein [Saprospiraceae bacterium]